MNKGNLLVMLLLLITFTVNLALAEEVDFVSILNRQDDWHETPYPYNSANLAELDSMDSNSDSVVTCQEACSSKGFKGCVYTVTAYHKGDETIYSKRAANPAGGQIDLELANSGADNHDKISMFYKCTDNNVILDDLDNIIVFPLSSQISDDDSFQTAAEFDINGDNKVDGEETCESRGYGNCIFIQKNVENVEIDKDTFTRTVNFKVDECSSSMDIAELDNTPSDYRNVKGMDVYCLNENPSGFAALIARIRSWFSDLFS